MSRGGFHLRDAGQPRNAEMIARAKAAAPGNCEACGWAPPLALDGCGGIPGSELLHAHHIRPVSCLGSDYPTNIVVLCPNCHAIAHRITLARRDVFGKRRYVGPQTREDMLGRLRLLDADPIAFLAEYRRDANEMRYLLEKAKARHDCRRSRLLLGRT